MGAHGISARQFGGWLSQAFAREDVVLAGHPENFSVRAAPGRNVNIVETLGDQVCAFFMQCWDGAAPSRRSSCPLPRLPVRPSE